MKESYTVRKDETVWDFVDKLDEKDTHEEIIEYLREGKIRSFGDGLAYLINEKDKDTEDDNIYVVIEDVYNEKTNEVTLNQFFTYYVEKRMGATSTLNTNIQSLFNSIFGDSIALYTSSSFQTFLLVNDMDITMNDDALAARFTVFKNYLINTSKSYKTDDQFNSWYDGTLDWTRPYQK